MASRKQIVIGGISSDIGRAIAERLVRESPISIVGTMRRGKTAADHFSGDVHIVDDCDLTDQACCKEVARIVSRRFEGNFAYLHSVGDFWDHVPFAEFGIDHAATMMESHYLTLYTVLQALLPVMINHGGGSCIALSCNSVRYNYPWMAAFTAAKSAMESLIRTLANEYASCNIRFNALRLASVKTGKIKEKRPYGDYAHFIPPMDIAPIVDFLMSENSYLASGNSIELFSYSETFFGQGFFNRIKK